MRLSTSTNIIYFDEGKNAKIPADVSVKICAEAGYKNLDANFSAYLREGMPLAQDDWESWSHTLRRLADSLGVVFTQSHGYFSPNNCLDIHGNRPEPFYDDYIRRSILASEILGADWMVLHPTLWPDSDGHGDYKKSFRYNKDFFAQWGEFASRHHVGIAIENMLNSVGGIMRYCVRAEEHTELIDAINDPMVKACIDTGHVHLSRLNLPAFIHAIGDRLRATHIADNHQNFDEHIAPFMGTISWKEVMQAFKDIRYELDFAFESHHLTSPYPAAIQATLVKFSYNLGKYLLSL